MDVEGILPYIPQVLLRSLVREAEQDRGTSSAAYPAVSASLEVVGGEGVRARQPVREDLVAVVLFADISGFTPLTEALAKRGDEGPEEITRILNHSFHRMIQALEAEGGDVVKFSGDALTVVFTDDALALPILVRRAYQAGVAIQGVMDELNPIEASVGEVTLGLKVGIGCGALIAMQVGGIQGHWEFVIAGEALRQAADAEGGAERGQVCLSPEALTIMPDEEAPSVPLTRVPVGSALLPMVQKFVPGTVLSWTADPSLHKWLDVLRAMTVLFVGVHGVSPEAPDAIERIHTLMQRVQQVVYRFQGILNKMAVDDKGTVLLVMFGAPPFAHIDDPLRALRCALSLQEVASQVGVALKTGVATGRVFAGPVGSSTRREYTVMGDTVNLAARLMSKSAPGSILCEHETYKQSLSSLQFEILAPVQLKGKSRPARVYRPISIHVQDDEVQAALPLIGREETLSWLRGLSSKAEGGANQVGWLEAEAGVGKSRLLLALKQALEGGPFRVLEGAGDHLEQQTSYWLWQELFERFFQLSHAPDREQVVQHIMQAFVPDMLPRLPLLNDLLGLSFPETPITETMEPALRQQSLQQLLLRLLLSIGAQQPLVVILDDVHWADSLSRELLFAYIRTLKANEGKTLLLLASRPTSSGWQEGGEELLTEFASRQLLLPLHRVCSDQLVAAVLGASVETLPQALCSLVWQRAEGNPFFIEELVSFLLERGWLLCETEPGTDERRCQLSASFDQQDLKLPDSIEGLLLARMDQLPPRRQLALKLASVIGRRFAIDELLVLTNEHTNQPIQQVLALLDVLREDSVLVREPETSWFQFRHKAAQEVAYRTLLYQQRRRMHQSFALWLEELFVRLSEGGPVLGESAAITYQTQHLLSLLVNHWRAAEQQERELHYAKKAGEHAASLYANEEAVRYFCRALALCAEEQWEERVGLLFAREQVYDLLGRREQQHDDLKQLSSLLEGAALGEGDPRPVQLKLRFLNYALATDQYDDAIECAQEAVNLAQVAQAEGLAAEGKRQWGWALHLQGKPHEAQAQLEAALALARRAGAAQTEAACLRHLGICHQALHDLVTATRYNEEALALARRLERRLDQAGLLNNAGLLLVDQGDIASAVALFQESWETFAQLGSRRGVGVSLSNLGYYRLKLGKFQEAIDALQQVRQSSREIDDRASESFALGALAECALRVGMYERAYTFAQEGVSISREIGHPFFEGSGLVFMAEALSYLGRFTEAIEALDKSLVFAEQLEDPEMKAGALLVKGQLDAAQTHDESALAAYKEAAALFARFERHGEQLDAVAGQVRVLARLGHKEALKAQLDWLRAPLQQERWRSANEPFWVGGTVLQYSEGLSPEQEEALRGALLEQLYERAEALREPALREAYLQQVPHHRALIEAL